MSNSIICYDEIRQEDETKPISRTASNLFDEKTSLVSSHSKGSIFNPTVPIQSENRTIPWRGIILALILTLMGLIFIAVSSLFIAGVAHIESIDNISPYAILIIGVICLIPGFYHIRLAICAYNGADGFRFEDIPNFD